jgi:hypothetical protein
VQDPKKSILSVLDRYLACYCAQDVSGLLKLFHLESPHFCFLGLGMNEKASSADELRRIFQSYFKQGKATYAKGEYSICRIEAPYAWLMGEFVFRVAIEHGGEAILNPRISTVFEKVGQVWLIQNLHCSMPWLDRH